MSNRSHQSRSGSPAAELPTQDWDRLEHALTRFEAAWRAGERPSIESMLEGAGSERGALLLELAHAELELRLRAGEPARAAEYLERFEELRRNPRWSVGLIAAEYHLRSKAGESLPLEQYLACYPQHADALRRELTAPGLSPVEVGQPQVPPQAPAVGLSTHPPDSAAAPTPAITIADVSLPRPGRETPIAVIPWPVRRLGRYEIGEVIAEGGMGQVLSARDPELRRDLAVKVILPEYRGHRELVRRFVEEAQITAQLPHPGVVPVHDIGRDEFGLPFLVMKLVRGETLEALLARRASLGEDLVRWVGVFEQVCQTVGFAHSRRVIHRDLKPLNIMVGRFGEVQVMDWGLAKVLSAGSDASPDAHPSEPPSEIETLRQEDAGWHTEGVLGTSSYMSPEQARGQWALVDRRADVFCLGGILCAILTGQPPYVGNMPEEVKHKAARADVLEAFARLDACGARAELVALAKVCLCPEPPDRPSDAQEVARRVSAYLERLQEELRAVQRTRAARQTPTEEERRQAEIHDAVTVALAQARALLEKRSEQEADPDRWRATVRAAQTAMVRARQRVVAGGASAELTQRVDTLERDTAEASQDCDLVYQLDRIRMGHVGVGQVQCDGVRAVPLYRAVLADYGIHLEDVAGAAARARSSRLRPALMAALDDWAVWTEDGAERRQLAAILWGAEGEENSLRLQWLAMRQRKDGASFAAMARAMDLGSLPATSLVLLGRYLLALGERLAAEQVLRIAQACFPTDFWVHQDLGMLLHSAGPARHADAVQYLSNAAALRTRNAAVQVNLGQALAAGGDVSSAIECYRKAIELDPAEHEAHYQLGLALQSQGSVDDAIGCFHKVLYLDPQLAVAHAALGSALQRKGDIDGAILWLQRAIDLDPTNAQAHHTLGLALQAKQEMDGAIDCFHKALDLDPSDPQAHYHLGLALEKDDPDRAIPCFRRALDLDPQLAAAHAALGSALQRKGDMDGAIRCFERVIDLDSSNVQALHKLGLALQRQGDVDGAIRSFRRVIEFDPNHAQAHYRLGLALQSTPDTEGAVRCFRRTITLDSSLRGAHTSLAAVLRARGDLDGAMRCLEQAIRLHPGFAMAHNDLGVVLKDKGDLARAIRCYRKALELAPRYSEALGNLVDALAAKGNTDEAVECCQRAIHLEPNFALGYYNLGRALLACGQFTAARQAAQHCLELLPRQDPSRDTALQLLRQCRVGEKLSAVLAGDGRATDAAETIQMAYLCRQSLQMNVAACRLFTEAFAAEPKLADDLKARHRYQASCCAALAGCGLGKDADKTNVKERARWRKQALEWLRAELVSWQQRVQEGNAVARATAVRTLNQWQQQGEFFGLRDTQALATLPAAERQAWQELWVNVAVLARRVQGKK